MHLLKTSCGRFKLHLSHFIFPTLFCIYLGKLHLNDLSWYLSHIFSYDMLMIKFYSPIFLYLFKEASYVWFKRLSFPLLYPSFVSLYPFLCVIQIIIQIYLSLGYTIYAFFRIKCSCLWWENFILYTYNSNLSIYLSLVFHWDICAILYSYFQYNVYMIPLNACFYVSIFNITYLCYHWMRAFMYLSLIYRLYDTVTS